MADPRFTSVPGDQPKSWEGVAQDSKSRAGSDSNGAKDAPDVEDDFVPPDMFGPSSLMQPRNASNTRTTHRPGADDPDFVPHDIFESIDLRRESPPPPAPQYASPAPQPKGAGAPPPPLPPTAALPESRMETKHPGAAAPPRSAATQTTGSIQAAVPRNHPPLAGMPEIPVEVDGLLRLAASVRASKLYLASNAVPSVRIGDVVHPLTSSPVLSASDIDRLLVMLALAIPSGPARNALTRTQFSFAVPDVGSVGCSTFRDSRGPGAVFRIAPVRMAGEPIDLSADIQALAVEREGLVIVAGPHGSGKQAVVDALLDLVNRARKGYVIAVRRELNAPSRGDSSLVSYREARSLSETLEAARTALQEDPDVLVLDEIRSAPLVSLAFDAAASGQLVIAGFTAPSASAAVERIIGLFPVEQARDVQVSLAQHLRGVVGQLLLPKIGGGQIAVRELLSNSGPVSSVLAAGKVEHLRAASMSGRRPGTVLLDDALVNLVKTGVVAAADAYRHAPHPAELLDALDRLGVDTASVKRFG